VYRGPDIFELLSRRHLRRLCTVMVVEGAELGVGCDVGVLVNCGTAVLLRTDGWCCVSVAVRFKADSHIACSARAVPLPCHAVPLMV
jgi:hypothetical protein